MTWLSDHLLSLILFTPLLAALILLLVPERKTGALRWIALIGSLIPFGLALFAWAYARLGKPESSAA